MASRVPASILASALLFAPVSFASSGLAQPAASSDRADELYRQGVDAFAAGKLEEAHKLLAEAWALKKGADIGANLGIVAQKLGKNVEAAEALSYAIEHFPVGANAEARQQLVDKLAIVKREVAAVTIVVNVSEASVSVDGRDLGKAPLAGVTWLDPGQHTFRAKRDGYEPAEVSFRLLGGDTTKIDLALTPAESVGPDTLSEEKLPMWPMLAFGGLTAVGLGVGIGFIVMSESAKGEIEDSSCRNATCGQALQGSVDDYNLGRSVAISGFVAAGVGAIGLVTYGVLYATSGSSGEPKPAATSLFPYAGPAGAGAVLTHTF